MVRCLLWKSGASRWIQYVVLNSGAGIWTRPLCRSTVSPNYLWRAVDHEGEVLESVVTKTWDRKAALKLLKKSMKRHGRPENIVTDALRTCGAALKVLVRDDDREMGRWLNNRAENSYLLFRRRERRCCGSSACDPCRSSRQSMPRSITIFRRSATS